jgi:hypothetical protein
MVSVSATIAALKKFCNDMLLVLKDYKL